MRRVTQRRNDRAADEVTVLEIGGEKWDERLLHRGPVRHATEVDGEAEEWGPDNEAPSGCCGERSSDEKPSAHLAEESHCN